MKRLIQSLPLIFAVLMIAGYRLLPHPWNFTPVCAAAIFGGLYLPRWVAFVLPLGSMIVADLFLGMDWVMTPVIYTLILMTVFVGQWARTAYGRKWVYALRIFSGALGASVFFFLVTNFVSWLSLPIYTKDWNGFVQCYTMAIPFFRNALAGDLLFLTAFVASYELLKKASTVVVQPKLSIN